MKISIQNSLILIITFSVLCFNFKTAILQYEFIFDNEHFTEKYCSNIKKPELKCNGKCHLKKISSEKETQNNSKKTFFDIEITFFNSAWSYDFKSYAFIEKKRKLFNDFLKKSIKKHPLEHPPQSLI